jgi:hypothetical protein
MKYLLLILAIFPMTSKASFIFNYGLNYSAENDSSDTEYDKSRMFHKVLIGGSINGKKTLFFGWNINSWSSAISYNGGNEDDYSMQEMGPKIIWFLNENYNVYLSAEWNPYAVGTRNKAGIESDIQGSSTDFALGYRFKISRLFGLGAGIHYHNLALKEQEINNTTSSLSDKVTNIMPMLELSLITK